MLAYDQLLQVRSVVREYAWNDRDVMLYALAIGMGSDPLNAEQLPFVYEKSLKVVPSFATVAAWGSNPPAEAMQIDYQRVVQADQSVILHKPMPPAARVIAAGAVTGAVDKGAKGAIIYREVVLRDAIDGDKLATLTSAIFARGDGGFGGPSEGGPAPHPVPERQPDHRIELPTRPDQALLYRLCGDRNPLHADPQVARKAGFDRPILHGLATYGITCHAVLAACTGYDPDRIESHQARFAAPVFPGETLLVDLWQDGGVISFEAKCRERDVVVIRNGKAVLR
jgi:acyl dehydratase